MRLRNRILLHIFFWLIVEATWFQHLYFHEQFLPGELEWVVLTHIAYLVTFYTFYFLFVFGFKNKNNKALIAGMYILAYSFICLLRYYGLDALYEALGNPQFFRHIRTYWSAFFETFMFGVHATFIAMIESRVKFEKLRKELSEQNAKSEMALLRSQINPHFLYNTLNNIYSLAYPKAEKAALAVMKLSDIMRYSLTEANNKFVFLQQEIDYLQSYISLEKMRHKDSYFIEFTVKGEPDNIKIAPMLFIPFVENAFKHGNNLPIQISLVVKNENITFRVVNHYTTANQEANSNGMGLKNVKRRLELIYPDRHELIIENDKTDSIFKMNLTINY